MKKRNKGIDGLDFRLKRPLCTWPGCTNKGRRVGKRKYSDRCNEHRPIYTAQ